MASPKKKNASSDERRGTQRTVVLDSFNLFFVIPEMLGMSRVYLRDISAGGLCFRSEIEIPLNAGQTFSGRLYLNPGFYLPLEARVVRTGGGEIAVQFLNAASGPARAIAKLQEFFEAAEASGVAEG